MEIAERIKRFTEFINGAKSKILEASKEYVNALDENTNVNVTEEFMKQTKLSKQALRLFEDIGRGIVDYRLLFEPKHISRILKKMPTSVQKYVLDGNMLDVYEPNSNPNDSRKVHYKELDKEQMKMVFSNDNIRDIGGQRNYYERKLSSLEDKRKQLDNLINEPRYDFTRKGIYFKRNQFFSWKELKEILCKKYGVENIKDIPE